jgi:hypothetical protein
MARCAATVLRAGQFFSCQVVQALMIVGLRAAAQRVLCLGGDGQARATRERARELLRSAARDRPYTTQAADGTLEVWNFEIELGWSLLKVRRWALYEVAFESEFEADARLAVFSPEPELRERIRTKMLPRIKTEPVLIEPDQIERIADYEEARRRPELAILGCLFHAQDPAPIDAQVEVFRAAWVAIQSLAETQARGGAARVG